MELSWTSDLWLVNGHYLLVPLILRMMAKSDKWDHLVGENFSGLNHIMFALTAYLSIEIWFCVLVMFNYDHYCISGCHVKWYCYCSVSILGAFTSCAWTLVLQKDFINGKALRLLHILCIILFYFPLSLLSTIASRMIMLFLFYRFATSSTRT